MIFFYILNPSAIEYCEVWVKVQFNSVSTCITLLSIHFRVTVHLFQLFYICVCLYVCYKCLLVCYKCLCVIDVICLLYMSVYYICVCMYICVYLFMSFKILFHWFCLSIVVMLHCLNYESLLWVFFFNWNMVDVQC